MKLFESSVCLLGAWLIACGYNSDSEREVGVASAALSACNETVPDNRYIDGIPAYAQCDATKSSAIYSNNGVDTATTSVGSDWVRTQHSGGYQCTELAHRYLHFKWQVKWIPYGNAGSWCDSVPPANSGMTQTMTPAHGDIMVLAPGSCGVDASTGHVTVVDTIDSAKARLSVVEQNGARRGQYMQSCAKCFLHVVANNGMNQGAPIAPPPVAGNAGAQGPRAGMNAPSAGATAPPSKRPAPVAGSTSSVAGNQTPSAGRAGGSAGTGATTLPSGGSASAGMPASAPPATGQAGSTAAGTPASTSPATNPPDSSGCSASPADAGNTASAWFSLWFVIAWSVLARARRRIS